MSNNDTYTDKIPHLRPRNRLNVVSRQSWLTAILFIRWQCPCPLKNTKGCLVCKALPVNAIGRMPRSNFIEQKSMGKRSAQISEDQQHLRYVR